MFTDEQQAIIDSTSNDIYVNAGPGMGKTHLLLGIAEKHNNETKGLLCFNAPIRKEIIQKANKNNINLIDINTFHSLAFNTLKRRGDINEFSKRDFENPLDYFSMLDIMQKLNFEFINSNIINTYLNAIKSFCKSDMKFNEFFNFHFQDSKEDIKKILNYLLNEPKAPMFHEVYIKIYQIILQDEKHKYYDCLMIDEFQDVSACYLSIINNITAKKTVRVGDTLQKIYGYNGALGMDQHNFRLSQSFRIGQGTADICNKLIDTFIDNPDLHMKGVNQNQRIGKIYDNEKKTIIFRTNKGLIERLIKESQTNKKCMVSESLYNELQHIYKLVNVSVFYPYTYRGIKFTSKEMLYEWYEKSKNSTLKKTIEFIETYKDRAMYVVYDILKCLVTNEKEADIYLTTTHRSKGLEFENVEIADDFPTINELIKKMYDFEEYLDEVYILYVAITRSYGKLQLNVDLQNFIGGKYC